MRLFVFSSKNIFFIISRDQNDIFLINFPLISSVTVSYYILDFLAVILTGSVDKLLIKNRAFVLKELFRCKYIALVF